MDGSNIGQLTPQERPRRQEHLEWVARSCKDGTCGSESAKYLSAKALNDRLANDIDTQLKPLLLEQGLPAWLAHHVIESHTKIFAILLAVDRAVFLNHFVTKDINDSHLPLHNPKDFPDYPGLFDDFTREQWRYCAPYLKHDLQRTFDLKAILPFQRAPDPIGFGGSAYIYKIDIDPEYDRLDNTTSPDTQNSIKVLKSYHTPDAQRECESETDAYRNIGPQPGLLRCYGRYHQDGKHHCILEFARGGSLEDVFTNLEGPRKMDDIMSLWTRLLEISKALRDIHTIPRNVPDSDLYTYGWHQDVKPSNILSCPSVEIDTSSVLYDRPFKIGDLGASHFRTYRQMREQALDDATFGSRTYGPPELYRTKSMTTSLRTSVTNIVDIWSLGAVFAECIVYVNEGRAGLENFRSERRAETDQIPDFQDGGCFHNGEVRLRCIDQMLDRIAADPRKDHVTRDLIPLVRDMLGEPFVRPNARTVSFKCEQFLAIAKAKLLPSDPSLPVHPLRLPAPRPPGPPPTSPTRKPATPPLISDNISPKKEQEEEIGHSKNGKRPNTYHQPGPHGVSPGAQDPGSTRQNSPSTVMPKSGKLSQPDIEDTRHYGWSPPAGTRGAPLRRPVNGIETYTINQLLGWHKQTIEQRRSFKKLVVGKSAYPEPGDGSLCLLNRVAGREHIFLVDDAVSMAERMNQVQDLVGAMAKLIKYKKLDKSGVDLHFAISQECLLGQQKATLLMNKISKVRTSTIKSDVPGRLEKILKDYTKKLRGREHGTGLSLYVITDGIWQQTSDARPHIRDLLNSLKKHEQPNNVGIQFIQMGADKTGTARLEELDIMKGAENLWRDVIDHTAYDHGRGNIYKIMIGSTDGDYDGDETPVGR